MAIRAIGRGWNMWRGLGYQLALRDCCGSIMTGQTGWADQTMLGRVKIDRRPSCSCVAVGAVIVSRDVRNCGIRLARGLNAIMAGDAGGGANLRMIEQRRLPCGRGVAILATQLGWNMRLWLGRQLALDDARRAIVASETDIGDL